MSGFNSNQVRNGIMNESTEDLVERLKRLKIRKFRQELRSGHLSPRQLYLKSGGMMKSDSKDEHRSEIQRKVKGGERG